VKSEFPRSAGNLSAHLLVLYKLQMHAAAVVLCHYLIFHLYALAQIGVEVLEISPPNLKRYFHTSFYAVSSVTNEYNILHLKFKMITLFLEVVFFSSENSESFFERNYMVALKSKTMMYNIIII